MTFFSYPMATMADDDAQVGFDSSRGAPDAEHDLSTANRRGSCALFARAESATSLVEKYGDHYGVCLDT